MNSDDKLGYITYCMRRLKSLFLEEVFPNAKEITESVGALAAFRTHFPFISGNDINVYVLGDGRTPRTGMVFAKSSNFNVYSIDPLLKPRKYKLLEQEKWYSRLHICPIKSQEFNPIDCSISVIIAVHSHAPFQEFWDRVNGHKIGIAIPCCVKHEIDNLKPIYEYRDNKIYSEKNIIKIWDNSL